VVGEKNEKFFRVFQEGFMNNLAVKPNLTVASFLPSGQTDTLTILIQDLPRGSVWTLTEILGGLNQIAETNSLDEAKKINADLLKLVGGLKESIFAHKRAQVGKG